ncbi:(2Fe-2S)-binding protein [Streptomyces sp. MBT53]|uniref:(2Fe-2S)-binding protein n=1 Tax=Streptomyces sp. MBT53 TaxID=1488384 RepID=UPI001911E96E|nr:(2Fe-2S)-binding protein [Streptomyces sp. MBT53]MBK6014795.1 (2Fe-2S)-binding protein [Streptomyces sp. MBT53]
MPLPSSAVADSYARLTEVVPGLAITELPLGQPLPSGGGWAPAAGLAAGGADLEAFLAWDDAQVLRDHGRAGRPDVIATFGLHRYAWPACLLFTVPWFLHRRVPRLPVNHVTYDRTAEGLDMGHLVVRTDSFACLPGDPAAALPGARVVADEEALRAEVRAAVAEHMEPLLAGFGPRMRRRGRALWGMATDEVVEGIWYVADLFGEQPRAVRELERLLPGATKPYVGSAAFREVTGPNGEALPTRDRASCCMYYTLDALDACPTCPRTCEAERVTKLLAAAAS